ncbi:serine/threonine protein kinase [Hyalangium versicolor]|uniref:serine/threonine protein kinase n=1 Tax=Hyalangium versicolor TaxID=2861190 RepID=UPI001CCB301A|nr:serine/threonine-protein kinase [Hyalangium versicolor]
MGSKQSLREVDPLCLPPGLQLGPWRILAWRGRGSYGTLYRVQLASRPEAGSFALKLAVSPGDERFEREAWLLQRIQSPHVPRLHAQGIWRHPSGAFPYLVMDWIDGEPLYEWSARRNPSSAQCAGMLAQVARALEATHAIGGLHRDVKGANVLVRPADGRVFLTDFGAGDYRGATTLTSKLLPPGTPAYRSPEAWGFLYLFRRHPTVHYPASACDDLFALGVMAYRLVTDEYPPSTHPEEDEAKVWREGGPGPRPPRALTARLSPELDAAILRLLSVLPDDRFGGTARGAAEALIQAAGSSDPSAHEPLFGWGAGLPLRWRSVEVVRRATEADAAARKEFELPTLKEQASPRAGLVPPQALVPQWSAELAVGFAGLLLAGLIVALFYQEPPLAWSSAPREHRAEESASVGDGALSAPVALEETLPTQDSGRAVKMPMPDQPLDGQRRPPCNKFGEVLLNGGCWLRVPDIRPPCKEEGKEDGYAWKGACYVPSYPPQRRPTSTPP